MTSRRGESSLNFFGFIWPAGLAAALLQTLITVGILCSAVPTAHSTHYPLIVLSGLLTLLWVLPAVKVLLLESTQNERLQGDET